ncbi:MAG: CooT family nickel-binding protein [Desulfobulbaceae bacterium]|nr:CooT family nickel-binding protein [Desulfobulbaceae bacterium]MCK5436609.1 CooT family nickel-binding protein [Desulfobulbaceae bacterium]MCK5544659.1 CooT family nickel-binding protein [Desulfobulbaceae bacterium]
MCQINVLLKKKDREEMLMEQVTRLEVLPEGIRIASLFEEPKLVPDVAIREIDFLDGAVILVPARDKK